ncbi:SGNH/GDSL hydrolase family protein [Streptomyces sp900129855]|jgi:lysophospholipase L1-like esterase|uniref:SGNH/GDSL hydrolase family protein n=1 Tax=Streptomyces sp. 900129855 TaxID=3155129 RepID=A0ABV2ZKS6_9ACTN
MGLLARTGLAGVVTGGILLVVIGVARPGDTNSGTGPGRAPGAAPVQGPYVALGDSYTSGPGIPDQTGTPTGCDRSSRNYPALVAKDLGIQPADVRDMSCSGATTTDLTAPQTTDHGTNPAQFSALSAKTRLVTLGIGGNDIGFSSMITKCVTAGVFYKAADNLTPVSDDAPCRRRYHSGDTDTVGQKIETTGQRLERALSEVKRRAPQARVYVVGYPSILPTEASACDDAIPLAPGDLTFLREQEERLNAMLRQRARAADATYIDTHTPSVGRDACSPAKTRWVEPLEPSSPAARVHPNARGERGMADAVLKAVRS